MSTARVATSQQPSVAKGGRLQYEFEFHRQIIRICATKSNYWRVPELRYASSRPREEAPDSGIARSLSCQDCRSGFDFVAGAVPRRSPVLLRSDSVEALCHRRSVRHADGRSRAGKVRGYLPIDWVE